MKDTLKLFITDALFNATSALLKKLNIQFDRETAEPIKVSDLYDSPMPQYLLDALKCVKDTFFIGIANDLSLAGAKNADSLDDVSNTIRHGGKYDGMFIFACDVKDNANLTRTIASALTRAFNRIASANPVILIIRQGNLLSLSTCERMNYTQEWRQGSGEKLGKVTILRNINCEQPHRGHLDILETLGDKAYPTFEELYKHWVEVFSSELLTKKFYNELSDWYAWAVMVAKFPNDLCTNNDDAKYNHEACIRLITRLIFVWFLKQKHLIPEEFFDEDYIRENLIENFDPHDKDNLVYKPSESKYYRLILQNLFFAMLNCPIVAEGKTAPNNRRFRVKVEEGQRNKDYNINNLMRYEQEFFEGGAEKFVKLANRSVPFLNGGLFDCLDQKPNLYYDGFSERKESLEQLFFPDYLFFGEEVGKGIDLSQWYDDKKKKNVSARGLIDILKRYCFTVEENTPYDQEVSLDPELLGKVFENLLAAYNPETKQSARKQTGSFYTPREIVQYMVDESLVAHLKRMCGDEMEPQYRQLLDYATDEVVLADDQRKSIMNAIYNCRVLDPACGSGAFPMGMLQQMVHVLKRIDPTNGMWKELMINQAIEKSKEAFNKDSEEERKARLEDIEGAFNQSINDPDYARKLYLIEHCIYGVDIQPIATQISKLRFFISLVVDQKHTDDAKNNFGIRPLPNLEARFVTANTLIPLDRSKDLFSSSDDVRFYEEQLQDINHRIFLAKKNSVKKQLQQDMFATRATMAQVMQNNGFIGNKGYEQLMSWNMFDQNSSACFFDPEWMFGVKGGFDVVIGNPPYVDYREIPQSAMPILKSYACMFESQRPNFFIYFIEKGCRLLCEQGCLTYINPLSSLSTDSAYGLRRFLLKNGVINWIVDVSRVKVFQEASTYVQMWNFRKKTEHESIGGNGLHQNFIGDYCIRLSMGTSLSDFGRRLVSVNVNDVLLNNKLEIPCNENTILLNKIANNSVELKRICKMKWGTSMSGYGKMKISKDVYDTLDNNTKNNFRPIIQTADIKCFHLEWQKEYIPTQIFSEKIIREFNKEKIVIGRLTKTIQASIDKDNFYVGKSTVLTDLLNVDIKFILGLLNSKLINFWYSSKFDSTHMQGGYIRYDIPYLEQIPIKLQSRELIEKIVQTVDNIIGDISNIEYIVQLDHLVYHLYDLTYDEVLVVDPQTPIIREEYYSFQLTDLG